MKKIFLCLAIFLISLSAHAALTFGFDSNLQGWTGNAGQGTITYQSTGGNPGGFLQDQDTGNGDMTVYVPLSALGNLSAYLNGTLSFDAKNISGEAADYDGFGTVTITGSAGTASLDISFLGNPVPGIGWITYSVLLDPVTWGAPMAAILADVTNIAIVLDFHSGMVDGFGEIIGFDNFQLEESFENPLPLPSELLLFLSGFMVMIFFRKNRINQLS